MQNLEPLAVTAAARMVGSDVNSAENMINKSLMVLAEQGVCAFGLFLASRSRQQDVDAAKLIHSAINDLLLETGLVKDSYGKVDADFYKEITAQRKNEDELAALQRLLLTKQLMETTLTYGRYQAKARAKA
ncbi:MAG: hypothetical protein WBI40_09235 [Methylococcaceae bacterium]